MIKSMTGYGAAKGSCGAIEISVELKSVNNRYLDCNFRLPRIYVSMEELLKAAVTRSISRGKVDVYINIDTTKAEAVTINLNKPLADAYVDILRRISQDYGLGEPFTAVDLLKLPDVIQIEKNETDTSVLSAAVLAVLEEALVRFNEMRVKEGCSLAADVSERLNEIERLTKRTEQISPKTVAEYTSRLESKMAEVLQGRNIEESRILAEAAIFADKVAINEETVRLRSHITQLRTMLESKEPVGRKLDFLIQELNREANTIGSKGNDAEMARIVIDLKAEIEKIREQAQNIE